MSGAQSGGDKTEKATPQKLRKAKQKGQTARSRDLATAIGLLVSVKIAIAIAPGWLDDFRQLFAISLAGRFAEGGGDHAMPTLFASVVLLIGKMLAPFAVVPVCIVAGSTIPGGWVFSQSNFMPKFERMNPIAGLKRLVSGKHYLQLATMVLKAAAMIAVLWVVCRANLECFVRLQGVPFGAALAGGATLFVDSVLALAGTLAAFALIDVPIQRLLFMRGQRMSKRDIKDEMKQSEGRPEVKGRIRQIQRQMAHSGIRRTVPDADVVVMNPTHYAVALKYDAARAQAPFVVAKGIDETALFIRDVAREHAVEVLELPPLARAIYHTSQVNQQIPAALYQAVAQVLLYVLQIDAFRRGARANRPDLPTALDIPEHLQDRRS
ncbi:flagellar biosynthetic protein FlhB [Burkholderia ubonensis]|uniref:flagellar type III secretion system protein FlhB n=1 Tax=Burkholderia ubonensis TaxID=101571 RepID=UPI00075D06A9|nr:flagellar type III secretion system protein FlhB [Burkholderia ubonensis]KVO87655.1 flagellar biosynthetic protein FlhB [Burkholderia ubonensis]KVZ57272.1 flagellar biosynthetic protein FlhB [Burkholderia ubonensis]KVZ72970.1 flagellar biosynthetic protein FlhB [Burkholderia ubonensis]